MNDTATFEMHCIVEIFGHAQIAGKVSEQTIAGQGFIRVDVPKTTKRDGFTRFYGPSAVYAMTPVSEDVAKLMAERLQKEPVSEWDLGKALKNLLPANAGDGFGGRIEIDEDDNETWINDYDSSGEGPDLEDEEATQPSEEDMQPNHEEPPKSERQTDKEIAAQWARDLLADEFVIFDTETTGFDPDDEIIQIGVIDQAGAVVLEQLVKPIKTVANSQYHGITNQMLADAPGFPEVYERIKTALEGRIIVAYNYEYDQRMLDQVCRKHALEPIKPSLGHCAMIEYAAFNGDWNDYHGNYQWVKLREALAAFGLKHTDFGAKEHDATTDAKATLALIKKMAEFGGE